MTLWGSFKQIRRTQARAGPSVSPTLLRSESTPLTAAPSSRQSNGLSKRDGWWRMFLEGCREQGLRAVSEHSDKWYPGVRVQRKTNCGGPSLGTGEEVVVRHAELGPEKHKGPPSTVIRGSGPHLAARRAKHWLMHPTQRSWAGEMRPLSSWWSKTKNNNWILPWFSGNQLVASAYYKTLATT